MPNSDWVGLVFDPAYFRFIELTQTLHNSLMSGNEVFYLYNTLDKPKKNDIVLAGWVTNKPGNYRRCKITEVTNTDKKHTYRITLKPYKD